MKKVYERPEISNFEFTMDNIIQTSGLTKLKSIHDVYNKDNYGTLEATEAKKIQLTI